jgi:hypothetical protein
MASTSTSRTQPGARSARTALLLAVLLGGLMPRALAAQSVHGPISTDRPGLGFSTSTVPSGLVQFEMSVPSITTNDIAGVAERSLGFPALVRIGIARGLEARIGSPTYSTTRVTVDDVATTTDGFGGLELGAKVRVTSGEGMSLVLIPSVSLPVGDDAVTTEPAGFTLNGVASWSLAGGAGLTTVVGAALLPDGTGDRVRSGSVAAIVSRALGDRTTGYVEAGWTTVEGGSNPVVAGGGLLFLINETLQVDAFVDRGVTDDAADWLFGVGIAVRR